VQGAGLRVFLAIGLTFTLTACAGGTGSLANFNPFNLFRSAGAQNPRTIQTLAPGRGYGFAVDNRPMVDQIIALSIEKTAAGAILRATAVTPTLGYHSADLVLVASDSTGEIAFQFRARPPAQTTAATSPGLREIVAAVFLNTAQLRGIRRLTVNAARNSRTIRR